MLIQLRVGSCTLLLLSLLSISSFAQTAKLLSVNPSFDAGFSGWTNQEAQGEILTRNWDPQSTTDGREFSADFGSTLLRVRGTGVWGQVVSLEPSATPKVHIVNAFAFKQPTSGTGNAGFACIAVTYYDANWKELQKTEIPVAGPSVSPGRGIGDGLNFYVWGINVPAKATRAMLFGYTTAGTSLTMDRVGLFDYQEEPARNRSLLKNPTFSTANSLVSQVNGNFLFCLGRGTEFWQSQMDWNQRPFFDGSLGSKNKPETVYQNFSVAPGGRYLMYGSISKGVKDVSASVGVDFFDASWNKIGQSMIDMNGISGQTTPSQLLVAPANAVRASFWEWCDRIPASGNPQSFIPRINVMQLASPWNTNPNASIVYEGFRLSGIKVATSTWFRMIVTDADGVDLASLGISDAYVTSRTNPSQRYTITQIKTSPSADGKSVYVDYFIPVAAANDRGTLVFNAGEIKDKLGNAFGTISFDAL